MTEKEKLEKIIQKCDELYWSGQESPLSDVDYDKLVRRLQALDPESPLLNKLPKTTMRAKKVVHEKPMLSLAKAYSLEEVLKWCKKVARSSSEVFKVQPKYDGLSGLLDKRGVLSSRGDGKTGEDYSDKLPFMKFLGSVREDGTWLGEIVITDADFKWMQDHEVKGKSGSVFKNQRNAVAGVVGADDVEFYREVSGQMKAAGKSLLTFVDYEQLSWEVKLDEIESRWEEMKHQIRAAGFPIDGIVVKLADRGYSESLGCTEHHPKGAIAFKFTNQSEWSVLREVEWTMGKDQVAAVGKIDPVQISGTTVQRVKLQLTEPTASAVETWLLNGSLQIGDEVLVERAGDIIPHVVESKPGAVRTRVVLEKCPFCGAPLEVGKTMVKCTNDRCPRKLVEKLRFAMLMLGFKGQGDSYAEKLHKLLGVDSVYKLMTLAAEDMKKFPELGSQLVDNFIAEQQRALAEAGALKALVAMDLPSIGKNVGKILLDRFGIDGLLNGEATEAEMLKLKGVGQVAASEASRALVESRAEIEKTLKLFKLNLASSGEQKQSGEKICFTGKMEKPRGEMEKLAASIGLQPVDHVDRETRWLVCADPSSTSSKMQKARKLGCEVISEAEFLKMASLKQAEAN